MLTINLKERFRNKTFLLSMIGAIVLLAQQLGFKDLIPNNYADVVNGILTILIMLGIVVDPSTKGISDKVVSNVTVQAINDTNAKEEVKTESSTTSINNEITENSQSGSADASATSDNKESETSADANVLSNIQINTDNTTDNSTLVIDPIAIQAENEKLKATLASIQSTAAQV